MSTEAWGTIKAATQASVSFSLPECCCLRAFTESLTHSGFINCSHSLSLSPFLRYSLFPSHSLRAVSFLQSCLLSRSLPQCHTPHREEQVRHEARRGSVAVLSWESAPGWVTFIGAPGLVCTHSHGHFTMYAFVANIALFASVTPDVFLSIDRWIDRRFLLYL